MQWSQLKKKLEGGFAEPVRGRVELWVTRYRHANEDAGEAWITFDKTRLISMGTWTHDAEIENRRHATDSHAGTSEDEPPQRQEEDEIAGVESDSAGKELHEQGIYSLHDAYDAFSSYINLSIDEILASGNPLIKALGMLDRRFGKRRLKAFDPESETVLVRTLFECRCQCEGLSITRTTPDADKKALTVAALPMHRHAGRAAE